MDFQPISEGTFLSYIIPSKIEAAYAKQEIGQLLTNDSRKLSLEC
jgi:hypothetical protein